MRAAYALYYVRDIQPLDQVVINFENHIAGFQSCTYGGRVPDGLPDEHPAILNVQHGADPFEVAPVLLLHLLVFLAIEETRVPVAKRREHAFYGSVC